MTTMAESDETLRVIGGVDTHKDVHVAAVLDELGRLLAPASFAAPPAGYEQPARWLADFGQVLAVGVEGRSSWGPGPARQWRAQGLDVIEVNRPHRQHRRGRSDTVDAEAAARAVRNGEASVVPPAGEGPVEAVRPLRVARRGAMKARSAAANQLHSLMATAPDAIRAQLRRGSTRTRVGLAAPDRVGGPLTPTGAATGARATVARRGRAPDAEIRELDRAIEAVLDTVAAPLLARHGVGSESAGALLTTAGDIPERIGRESSYAALCGSSTGGDLLRS